MDLSFLRKQQLTDRIWAFEFQPERPLAWTAGQFIRVEVPHEQADGKGTKRFFTVAAAPDEGIVRLATRLTGSSFKTALDQLETGQPIRLLDLPAGDFTWGEDGLPRLFVAQGIGITPFYSMLRQRHMSGLPLNAHLVHAHHPAETPFRAELEAWRAQHPELHLDFTAAPLDAAILAGLVPGLAGHRLYIAGPKAMTTLLAAPYNVPVANIKQDRFSGYAAASY